MSFDLEGSDVSQLQEIELLKQNWAVALCENEKLRMEVDALQVEKVDLEGELKKLELENILLKEKMARLLGGDRGLSVGAKRVLKKLVWLQEGHFFDVKHLNQGIAVDADMVWGFVSELTEMGFIYVKKVSNGFIVCASDSGKEYGREL